MCTTTTSPFLPKKNTKVLGGQGGNMLQLVGDGPFLLRCNSGQEACRQVSHLIGLPYPFMLLSWAIFITILSLTRCTGHRLDTKTKA